MSGPHSRVVCTAHGQSTEATQGTDQTDFLSTNRPLHSLLSSTPTSNLPEKFRRKEGMWATSKVGDKHSNSFSLPAHSHLQAGQSSSFSGKEVWALENPRSPTARLYVGRTVQSTICTLPLSAVPPGLADTFLGNAEPSPAGGGGAQDPAWRAPQALR